MKSMFTKRASGSRVCTPVITSATSVKRIEKMMKMGVEVSQMTRRFLTLFFEI